jgi:HK97 family phage major capsid protein
MDQEMLDKVKELLGDVVAPLKQDIAVLKEKSALEVSVPGLEADKKKFSFSRAYKGIVTGDWKDSGFEKEVFDASRTKAQSVGSDLLGGYLVPTELSTDLIEMLQAKAVLTRLGSTVINLEGHGVMEMPKQVSGSTAQWLGENTTIPDSDIGFGTIQMSPKMVAGRVVTSRRLLGMANQSVEALIRADLIKSLQLAIDQKGIYGDGTGNTPVGILNTADVQVVSTSVTPTYNSFDDLAGLLEDENVDLEGGNLAYLANPKVFRKLKRQTVANYAGQTNGTPLFAPIMSDKALAEALGYAFGKTTQMTVTSDITALIFGDFQQLLMGFWNGIMLEATKEGEAFTKHQVMIKAVADVDFAIRQPKAFACYDNVTLA